MMLIVPSVREAVIRIAKRQPYVLAVKRARPRNTRGKHRVPNVPMGSGVILAVPTIVQTALTPAGTPTPWRPKRNTIVRTVLRVKSAARTERKLAPRAPLVRRPMPPKHFATPISAVAMVEQQQQEVLVLRMGLPNVHRAYQEPVNTEIMDHAILTRKSTTCSTTKRCSS